MIISICLRSALHERPTDGHTRLETGAPDVLDVSYMEMELDPAAKVGSERWCETEVKAELPCHVAFGADFEACAYGSNS